MTEHTGQGSSGSWRDDEVDSTHEFKKGDWQADIKVSAFKKRQGGHVHYQPLSVRAQRRQAAMARMHRNLKPMRFVSLHHHTTYSFLDGFQLPDAHVRRATEINMGAMGVTEHGNTFSHVKFEQAALEAGVKPIFGCEVYTGWVNKPTQKKNHLTILAMDDTGYTNLLELITRSWEEGFYHEPTVDPRWLVDHQEGLCVLSGCQGSALFTALVGGKHVPEEDASYKRGLRVARWFSDRLDHFFVEVQAFPELEKTCRANPLLARVAHSIGRPLVATMDVHYTAPEEVEIQKILHNVRPGNKRTLEDQVRDWGYDAPLCPPATDMSIYRRLRATGLTKEQAVEAIVSTEEIAQECNVTLPKLEPVKYPLPPRMDSERALWRKWLREGWHYRGFGALEGEELDRYRKQLKEEMELIESKNFVGYFLIVADGVRWAKEQQIPVGPARGSAAASLCCYLLRITEVDPLVFPELSFERFLDPTRKDLPDIDLDFAPSGLPKLREYYQGKYGVDMVSTVGTFTGYKSKAAVDDAAKVFKVPKYEAEKLKDLLLERSKGDLRASAGVQDTVDQFEQARAVVDRHPELRYAMDLEGNVKGFGTHAAGLVVANQPLHTIASVLTKEVNGEVRQVVGMDKYDAERQGLMKLDFLSLATMDQIAECLRLLDMTVEDLYDIPLDDPEVVRGFQENDTVAIFQFDGRTMRFLNSMLKPDNFSEVAHAVTLARPGPMLSGASQQYVAVKEGADYEHVHPALEAITQTTNYQVIFQEQILKIVRDIGGFDYTHRAQIRQIIAKKRGEQEMNREWLRFRDGAAAKDIDEDTARRIWGIISTAGAYVFNAAHSYSYGMLGWWCMWFKRHHPPEFYASGLSKLPAGDDGVRHEGLRRDAFRKGLRLLPPAPESEVSWTTTKDGELLAGWEQVKGVGEKTAPLLVEHFQNGGDWENITQVPGIGPKTKELLQAFRERSDPFGVQDLERALAAGQEAAAGAGLPTPTATAREALDDGTGKRMVLLVQPQHRNLRELFEVHRARTGEELDPSTVRNFDPDKTEWVLMPARDSTDTIQLIFTRNMYPSFKEAIWGITLNHDVVLVEGRKMVDKNQGGKSKGWGKGGGIFHVHKMWVINPDEED